MNAPVVTPLVLSSCEIMRTLDGSLTMSVWVLCVVGYRPVSMVAQEGLVQSSTALNRSYRTPSRAKRSNTGVLTRVLA